MSSEVYQAEYAEQTLPEGTGLWRDGRSLVVDLAAHAFPHRCLKTDLPLKDAAHAFVSLRTYNVIADELNLVRGLVVASTGQMLTISENSKGNNVLVPLGVPLAPEWQAKLKSNFGLILAVSSIVLTVLLFIATMLLAFANNDLFIVPAIGCGLGVVGMISGFVMMTRRDSSVLSIKRLADRKVWLSGVHHDWLSRLPEFRASPEFLGREIKRAESSRWWSFATAIVFGIAAIVCVPIAANGYLKGIASRDWPSIEGKLYGTHVTAHSSTRKGRTTRWWNVNFNYDYTVNNEQHSGKSYEKEHSAEAAEANRQRKPDGTPVTVFYNPGSPGDHRLERGISDGEVGWLVAAAIVSIIGLIAACYGLAARSRGAQYQSQLDELALQPPGKRGEFGFANR
jgi:hypothetical protein